MKGIVLAGGSGSRLNPITSVISKHILPIYDKPMIYYPISVLMLAGIRDILIISTPRDVPIYEELLGSGSSWGLSISYEVQKEPNGVAEALVIGEEFIGDDPVMLILGDNVFWGHGFSGILSQSIAHETGATIFCYKVADPHRFGVAEVDRNRTVISVDEKPHSPRSDLAITGLYVFDNNATHYVKSLNPSSRGELEITDLVKCYLEKGTLRAEILGRGFAWLDTGTHESLLEAGLFVSTMERRQGVKIACLEEVALANDWITKATLAEKFSDKSNSTYADYVKKLISE